MRCLRYVGLALMVIGVIILVVSVPCRFWAALLGCMMVFVGFVIWRI